MRTIVLFLKNHGPYSPGDAAGFDDAAAQALLSAEIAELVGSRAPAVEVAPATPEAADVGDAVQAAAQAAPRKGRAKP